MDKKRNSIFGIKLLLIFFAVNILNYYFYEYYILDVISFIVNGIVIFFVISMRVQSINYSLNNKEKYKQDKLIENEKLTDNDKVIDTDVTEDEYLDDNFTTNDSPIDFK